MNDYEIKIEKIIIKNIQKGRKIGCYLFSYDYFGVNWIKLESKGLRQWMVTLREFRWSREYRHVETFATKKEAISRYASLSSSYVLEDFQLSSYDKLPRTYFDCSNKNLPQ